MEYKLNKGVGQDVEFCGLKAQYLYLFAGGLLAGATEPQLADLSKMPFMAGGKLFFSKDNKNYVASAELICRRNLVLTAAHCIQDKTTGHLGDNYMFERCYNDGSSAEKLTFKTVALKAYWYG